MTDTTPTQEDRDAAAGIDCFNYTYIKEGLRNGTWDEHQLVQAFARHRQAAIASVIAHATSAGGLDDALTAWRGHLRFHMAADESGDPVFTSTAKEAMKAAITAALTEV